MLTCEGQDIRTHGPALVVSHTAGGYPATGATCVGMHRNALWLFNNKNNKTETFTHKSFLKIIESYEKFQYSLPGTVRPNPSPSNSALQPAHQLVVFPSRS